MTLKEFDTVNINIRTQYCVYSGESFVEYFTVDYLSQDLSNAHDAVCKKLDYIRKKAKIKWVNFNKSADALCVYLEV